jgi:chaperone required for assembly of F1-ATPase
MQLLERQERVFGPVIEWANERFGISLETTYSLYGCEQLPDVSLAYAEFLGELKYPQLLALAELAGACKSLLIAFTVHGRLLNVAEVRLNFLWNSVHMLHVRFAL